MCGSLGAPPCCSVPLPNNEDVSTFDKFPQYIHIADGGVIQVRSDYALWCTRHCGFVQKQDCGIETRQVAASNVF
jgi:hypothetical protein